MRIPSLDGGGKLPEKFVPSRLSEAALATAVAQRVAAFPLENYLAPGQAMPNTGTTDASALIQAALVDMQAKATADTTTTRIYVVDLPAGTFRLDTSLIRNMASAGGVGINRIGVRGAGRGQTILKPTGGASGFDAFSPGAAANQPCATNCQFGGFTIELAAATHPDPTGASYKGIKGRGWVDCTFDNIDVLNSPATAIGTDFPVRVVFNNVHVRTTGTGAAGTTDTNGAVDPANPITAAKSTSGFGIGFGLRNDESVSFINCTATNCYRGGFFFEAFEDGIGNNVRKAVITMVRCRSWANRVGILNVGGSGVTATNCEITDNTIAGYYGGVSLGTTTIASVTTTLENCQLLRNGIGVYATGDFTLNHNYVTLRPVLGGYRILNSRIEDSVGAGVYAERYKGIEAGGLTIRGNQFRRNGKTAITLGNSDDPLRDLTIDRNYFDANVGAAVELLAAMNAPEITGNTFVNADGGTTQTKGLVLHPGEPVTAPRIQGNTFRQITTPMAYVSRLDQTLVKDNRTLDATTDPATAGRMFRQAFYGTTDDGTFPVASDGWAKNTAGSQINWTNDNTGIIPSGAAGSKSYLYRDLATSGVFVSATISSTTSAATASQPLGVMLSMGGTGTRTCVVAGVNGADATHGTSSFYSVWKIVSDVPTKLWESTVPLNERHTIGLARLAGSTVTQVFIDGELVNTIDITDVPAGNLHGVFSKTATGMVRHVAEFRALAYTG